MCVQVFQRATTYMSGSTYPTLCVTLQQYTLVLKHVDNMSKAPEVQEIPSLKYAVERCRAKLLKFFDKSTFESEFYFFAAVLDPRYKLSLFESNPDLFGPEWVAGCRGALIDRLLSDYDTEDDVAITGGNTPASQVTAEDAWEKEMQAMLPDADVIGISASDEFSTYLAEPRNRMDPLDWWRINRGRFPRLAKMASDFLAIPGEQHIHFFTLSDFIILGSSVSVERSFNCGRDIISIRRHSLSSETLRSLMVSRSILKFQKSLFSVPANPNKRKRVG